MFIDSNVFDSYQSDIDKLLCYCIHVDEVVPLFPICFKIYFYYLKIYLCVCLYAGMCMCL